MVTTTANSSTLIEKIFNNTHTAIAILDKNFNFIRVNEQYAKTAKRSVDEFPGRNHFAYYPNDEAEAIFTNVVQTKQSYQIHGRPFSYLDQPERGITYWDWTLEPILDDQGEVEILILMLADVTEQKQKENRSNRQIRNILETISDGFFILDNDWQFTYLNKGARAIYPKVIIGQRIWDIYPKLRDTIFYEKYQEAKYTGKPVRFESQSLYSCKWFKVNVYPSPEGLSVYFLDITERKNAEERKEVEHQRLILLINSLPQLVYLLAPDYTIRLANNKFKEMFGNTDNRPCYNIFFAREEPCAECPTLMVFSEQVANYWECTFSNGRHFGIYENPFYDLNGEPLAIKIGVDLTERKNTEQEMARLDRLDMIGKMAAGIGHEVRNPMTTVRGFLQMLGGKPKFAEEKEYFDLMINELDRANSIITEFLSLARNRPCELEMNNLNQIIEEIYPLLQADALNSDKNLLLELTVVPDLFLNKKEIRQLILNFVKNGLEAMSPGGNLLIKTFVTEEQVVLAISDEGTGIDSAVLDKLGTPFLTTKEKGTGLGLATCYNIAERNNGKIDVETSPLGTTFYVRFSNNW